MGRFFADSGERIFLVGGAVRSLCLGDLAGIDLDFTTSASPEVIRRIARPLAKTVYDKSGVKGYGTQGIILPDGLELEITPFRAINGIEAPAGDPSPALAADLLARDFTINAIAIDLAPETCGEIVDPGGGARDLENRILRFPSDPTLILEDDPLRAFRAVRFALKYSLEIPPRDSEAIKTFVKERPERMSGIAGERIRDELFKTLVLPAPSRAALMMEEFGLLERIFPEVQRLKETAPEAGAHHKDLFEHTIGVIDRAAELRPGRPLFILAALLHDIGKPQTRTLEDGAYRFDDHDKAGAAMVEGIAERLRLSTEESRTLKTLVLKHHRLHQYTPEWSGAAVRRALHDLGDLYEDFLALSMADATGHDPQRKTAREERLRHFLARVETIDKRQILHPRLPLDGNEVMKLLGMSAKPKGGGGRVVGEALSKLKEQVIAGIIAPDDADAARRFILSGAWKDTGAGDRTE